MGFLKRTIHSILGFPNSKDSSSTPTSTTQSSSHHHCGYSPPNSGCFCLIAGDTQKPPNVAESVTIKPTSTSIFSPTCSKKGSSTFGFLFDDSGNGVNGLLPSCTESLGFESSDHPMEESLEEALLRSRSTPVKSRWKTAVAKVRRQDTKFPPPLPSLNQNGQRSFYLKPMRRNGRLELTEVRIQRPEVFRASRQDGRLRLMK